VISGSGNSEQIFRYTNGTMAVLGGLGEFNRALGMNSAGDVVGYGLPVLGLRQGFFYSDGKGMQGLNQLIDATSGWYILGAGGINDAGQIAGWASGPSGQRAVRLTPGAPPPPTPPAAPTALTASVLSSSRVLLNWSDNSGNEQGFRVQRAQGAGSFVLLAELGANATGYSDATVRAGKVYQYRVRAFNQAGTSAWSNTIKVRVRR